MEAYTVAQLIKALQDLPQELSVLDDCCEGIVAIDIIQDNNPFLPRDYIMLKTYRGELNFS